MTADEQFAHIASRVSHVITPERLKELLARGTPMRVKFGIDPTGHDVHLGHAVPIILAGRLQRMGHQLVIIIGDVTAKIGDPSGRTKERPPLTDEDIARNLETYKEQMAPFIDFSKAELRRNSNWLLKITTPELLALLSRIPVSMQLQREDFRKRLEAGHSLSTAELLYSVYMAYDSVAIEADVEIGGVDQLLNMQMCRKVMEVREMVPEVILTTDLIEGTDGSGEKMSKSKGNYVGLNESPEAMYGKVMSIPDRLLIPYFTMVTECSDGELALLKERMGSGAINPMDAKHLLAFDIVSALRGPEAAERAREQFTAQFSKRTLRELADVPTIVTTDGGEKQLVDVLVDIGFAQSKSDARRLAEAGGVQLVAEGGGDDVRKLTPEELRESVATVLNTFSQNKPEDTTYFLKVGRQVARII
jgi:tyrosyl-tRNA synthetase